jgi:hypothetical protein
MDGVGMWGVVGVREMWGDAGMVSVSDIVRDDVDVERKADAVGKADDETEPCGDGSRFATVLWDGDGDGDGDMDGGTAMPAGMAGLARGE